MVSKKRLTAAIIALVVLLGIVVFLAFRLSSAREEGAFLQSGVDRIYQYNFSRMKEMLFGVEASAESDAELAKCAYTCSSVYSYTSYEKNTDLQEIAQILGDAESSAQLRENFSGDTDFQNKLGRLALYPANEELAQEVLTYLQDI